MYYRSFSHNALHLNLGYNNYVLVFLICLNYSIIEFWSMQIVAENRIVAKV